MKSPHIFGKSRLISAAIWWGIALVLVAGGASGDEAQQRSGKEAIAARLLAAYSGIITAIEGNDLVFADGARLPLDDGAPEKSLEDWLEKPDIKDMFRQPYKAGDPQGPPPKDWDPGRARNAAFFTKVYGDCSKGEVEKSLVDVVWLPKKNGRKLKMNKINGAADRLKAVSEELDTLPARFNVDLIPSAGTYMCRKVAGTEHRSPHGYGIAIDIALKHSAYWRWFMEKPGQVVSYRNAIPMEIVRIFEKNGFIWGGKWYHFDTMHFEYRPELLPPKP